MRLIRKGRDARREQLPKTETETERSTADPAACPKWAVNARDRQNSPARAGGTGCHLRRTRSSARDPSEPFDADARPEPADGLDCSAIQRPRVFPSTPPECHREPSVRVQPRGARRRKQTDPRAVRMSCELRVEHLRAERQNLPEQRVFAGLGRLRLPGRKSTLRAKGGGVAWATHG
jgi:hypothetical protein